MAVTLFGNVFAMMAKLDVMRAAAPSASTTRTSRHITANGIPSGLPSTNLRIHSGSNKKLSYPQRKCASNMAILYGAEGIST